MSIQERFRQATGRKLTVEYRPGYGWFICEKGQSLMGFHSKKLLMHYLWRVEQRGMLYTPTISETYGSEHK